MNKRRRYELERRLKWQRTRFGGKHAGSRTDRTRAREARREHEPTERDWEGEDDNA